MESSIDWLIDCLIGWLIVRLADCLIGWLIDWLIDWFTSLLALFHLFVIEFLVFPQLFRRWWSTCYQCIGHYEQWQRSTAIGWRGRSVRRLYGRYCGTFRWELVHVDDLFCILWCACFHFMVIFPFYDHMFVTKNRVNCIVVDGFAERSRSTSSVEEISSLKGHCCTNLHCIRSDRNCSTAPSEAVLSVRHRGSRHSGVVFQAHGGKSPVWSDTGRRGLAGGGIRRGRQSHRAGAVENYRAPSPAWSYVDQLSGLYEKLLRRAWGNNQAQRAAGGQFVGNFSHMADDFPAFLPPVSLFPLGNLTFWVRGLFVFRGFARWMIFGRNGASKSPARHRLDRWHPLHISTLTSCLCKCSNLRDENRSGYG